MSLVRQQINELINTARVNLNRFEVCIVANVENITKNISDYTENSITTEFLELSELDELVTSAQGFGIYTTVFYDTTDFIEKIIKGHNTGILVLFEMTQKGTGKGKDTLLPSFCDMIGCIHTGPNAYSNAITGNKYAWTKLLEAHNIPVPRSWRFSNHSGWLNKNNPPTETLLIAKPLYECASIGIGASSVGILSDVYIRHLSYKSEIYRQPFIVQEFIPGYEVEVPVISTVNEQMVLPPIGISFDGNHYLGGRFLSYDSIFDNDYHFYDFSSVYPHSEKIEKCVKTVAELLELDGYTRVDFRIKESGEFYITDINAYPHIVSHSSFAKSFELLGFEAADVLPALVGNALATHKVT